MVEDLPYGAGLGGVGWGCRLWLTGSGLTDHRRRWSVPLGRGLGGWSHGSGFGGQGRRAGGIDAGGGWGRRSGGLFGGQVSDNLPHVLARERYGAEEEDVVEGTLVHHVEAGFVAMEEGEIGGRCEFAESGGDARAVVTGGREVDLTGQEIVFDGPGTAQAPVRGGHLLDHGALDDVEGAESVQVFLEEGFEALQ